MIRCLKCAKWLAVCQCEPMSFPVVSSTDAVTTVEVPRHELVRKLDSLKKYRAHINDLIEKARITHEIRAIEDQLR